MNTTPKTYHVAVGFPADVRLWSAPVSLEYGHHARVQGCRYSQTLPLPATLDPQQATLIEIEVQHGYVVKALYRLAFTSNSDLCLVVTHTGFVKTVWLNSRNDAHTTLDRSKYATPEIGT